MSKTWFNFNKELIFGEIGAMICAPLFSYVVSTFTNDVRVISASAVVGAVMGAGIIWLSTRILDNKDEKNYAKKQLLKDLMYFTPVAFLLTLIVYYPTLFFASEKFIGMENKIISSVFLAQVIAFFSFLIFINIYRGILIKFFNKKI